MTLQSLSTATSLSGETVRRLMRAERITIRELAARMDVSQARVRRVREGGVEGPAVRDWVEALTGFLSITWSHRTVEQAATICGVCRDAAELGAVVSAGTMENGRVRTF